MTSTSANIYEKLSREVSPLLTKGMVLLVHTLAEHQYPKLPLSWAEYAASLARLCFEERQCLSSPEERFTLPRAVMRDTLEDGLMAHSKNSPAAQDFLKAAFCMETPINFSTEASRLIARSRQTLRARYKDTPRALALATSELASTLVFKTMRPPEEAESYFLQTYAFFVRLEEDAKALQRGEKPMTEKEYSLATTPLPPQTQTSSLWLPYSLH